jgi:hypothetical protein
VVGQQPLVERVARDGFLVVRLLHGDLLSRVRWEGPGRWCRNRWTAPAR